MIILVTLSLSSLVDSFLDVIYLFLERGEGREKDRERNTDVREVYRLVASRAPPTGDLAHNPGMCPDRALNQ